MQAVIFVYYAHLNIIFWSKLCTFNFLEETTNENSSIIVFLFFVFLFKTNRDNIWKGQKPRESCCNTQHITIGCWLQLTLVLLLTIEIKTRVT